MYVTEEKARGDASKKPPVPGMQCRAVPMLAIPKQGLGGMQMDFSVPSCVASMCMLWRWGPQAEGEEPRGCCGLAIPPQFPDPVMPERVGASITILAPRGNEAA